MTAVLAVLMSFVGVSGAWAADIISDGPLTNIRVSEDLDCAVDYEGDSDGEWYEDTACGTFVATDGHLYGPRSIPAGESATGIAEYEAFTPVSQAGPSGAGTATSPFVLTTTVLLCESGLTLTQTDRYVTGEDGYLTDVTLSATDDEDHSVIVYRAGDCYLQDSDFGLGRVDSGGVPVCEAGGGSANPDRIEAFYPLTAGSQYIEDDYDTMWAAVGAMQDLPDTCRCDDFHDNAAAISWSARVAASSATRRSSLVIFSPAARRRCDSRRPLTTTP